MDETFNYSASGETNGPPAIASFDGGTGNDTLNANWIGSDKAGDGILTEFTENPDGSFSARYYDNRNNSVTITNIENVHIHAVNRYFENGNLVDEGGYRDVIITGRGNDVIFTDNGIDFVNAGSGTNDVDGGDDDDFISADLSAVTTDISWNLVANTYSGPGTYTNFEYFVEVTTGSGDDTIVSGGPDAPYSLVTGAGGIGGNEVISTGAGNDSVTVSQGRDTVDLGQGRDRLIIDYRDGAFNGNSTLSVTQTSAGTYSGSMTTIFNNNLDGVTFTGAENFTVMTDDSGGNGYNSVDTITTGGGNDVVFTFHSDDLIDVGKGTDRVDGGTGIDGLAKTFNRTDAGIVFDLAANTFKGRGRFTNIDYFTELRATDNDDVIVTGLAVKSNSSVGNDTIFTLGGNDTVTLFNDVDSVNLGAGDDRLILDYSQSAFQGNTTLAISGTKSHSGTFDGVYASAAHVTFAGVEHFTVHTNSSGGNGYNSADTITTGNGDDIIFTYHSSDTVSSGGGDDFVDAGSGNDTVNGGAGNDILMGGAGSDSASGNDVLNGGKGADKLNGGGGKDQLNGGTGNDKLIGGTGDDVMNGGAGNDVLKGGGNNDRMDGGGGDDKLIAGAGTDILTGGKGADVMKGGGGSDSFKFNTVDDTSAGSADRILDFKSRQGDLIDLSGIDAKSGKDNQAFSFIGDSAFSGHKGELRIEADGSGLRVLGDTDGDGTADLAINVLNVTSLVAGDFIL